MKKKLHYAISKFYHDMAVDDLKQMNSGRLGDGITYNSLLYLDLIYTHQGKYTASAIANLLHVSKPAVITKVNELMHQNFVYKEQSKTDKRVYYLFVNEDTLPHFKDQARLADRLEEKMKKLFKEEEIDMFCHMLRFVGEAYSED